MYSMEASIHEAKSQLSKLLKAALAGEKVIITKAGTPLVELVPVENKAPRRVGEAGGAILYMADDFDEPLDDFSEYQ